MSNRVNRVEIDKRKQQKIGPHKSCQVVLCRGIVGHWKQPVYYKFNSPMTADIITQIISRLHSVGFCVTGIVSDMGSSNVKLWSELNIGYNKNCFLIHPNNQNLNVFVFADDVPHYLKLARNHIMDQGFHLHGKFINKSTFEAILSIPCSELTLPYKINRCHLDLRNSERRVRPAVLIFLNTLAKTF